MKNHTRQLFNGYTKHLASLNGVESVSTSFSATPEMEQTLVRKVQETSEFLSRINMPLVSGMTGQKIGIGVSAPSASRTNTDKNERQTRDLSVLDPNGYQCVQTNYDTHLKYAQLDAWARHPEFQTMVRDAQLRSEALARIMVGFNGVKAAQETDQDAYPLLQDVNKGWLQHVRERASERVLNAGHGGGKVRIGKGGDYADLDAAVFDLKMLLEPWYQNDTQLVAIVGSSLLHDKYMPIINQSAEKASEKLAADLIVTQKRIGNQAALSVPYMPNLTVMVTRLDNLSLYVQESSRRRHIIENPKRDRVEAYNSTNDAYVIEDFGCVAILENIQLIGANGEPVNPDESGSGG